MSRGRRWIAIALLLAAGALYVAHALSFGDCLQDDAYISLRFSQHLAEGHGLVYNVGEKVEGYTNFLWTVLGALPFALGADPEIFLLVLGIASGLLAISGAALLAQRLAPGSLAGPLAAVLVASLPHLVAESVMGLETALFAGLALLGLTAFLAEREPGGGRSEPWRGSGILLALAALTRPEGVLVAGLLGLVDLGSRPRTALRCSRFWMRWGTFALPVGVHLAFRRAFYGDWVPNTFHAKVGGGFAALGRGIAYLGDYAIDAAPLLVLVLLAAWSWRKRDSKGVRPGRLASLATWAIPIIYLLYVVKVGGDYKPTYRFLALPSLFFSALAAVGTVKIGTLWRREQASAWLALAAIGIASFSLYGLGGQTRDFADWRARVLVVHKAAGRWLASAYPAGTVLATGNAGVVPYFTRFPTIDMYGLCDRHIAARVMPAMGAGPAGHEKGDGAYVLERDPMLILFMRPRITSAPLDKQGVAALHMSVSERELWNDARFHERYELVSERIPGFYFNYFRRKPRS